MRVYTFGDETSPAIMLLPGTCCHWKSNFGHVIPLLAKNHHVLCVSYDGFDENEDSEFTTMTDETEKIENYIKRSAAGISARLTAVRSAARLSGSWRRDGIYTWTTGYSAAQISIRRHRSRRISWGK